MYDPNNPEDDMEERYEEMSRMREHVMKELDKDGDKLVSMDEFLQYTRSDEFNKDEGWDVSAILLQSSVSALIFVFLILSFMVARKESRLKPSQKSLYLKLENVGFKKSLLCAF